MQKLYIILLSSLLLLTACSTTAQDKQQQDIENPIIIQDDKTQEETYSTFESDTIDFRLLYELSEKEPNQEIEKTIKDYFFEGEETIPDNIYYAYDFFDLNDDDNDEAIVIVSGSYFSGSGGDTMLILSNNNDSWQTDSIHSLVREPMIISDNKSNGYHNIIFKTSGGGHHMDYHIFEHDGISYPVNPSIQSTIKDEVASGISIFSDTAFNESFVERVKVLHKLK